jgi:hypothetical protein
MGKKREQLNSSQARSIPSTVHPRGSSLMTVFVLELLMPGMDWNPAALERGPTIPMSLLRNASSASFETHRGATMVSLFRRIWKSPVAALSPLFADVPSPAKMSADRRSSLHLSSH